MTRSRFERAIVSLRRQGIKYDLARMHVLAERMGHPHRAYHTLHVTGTNGKGSTAAFLASVLQAAGYRVGLNTSPHLVSFRERIRVDGRALGDDSLLLWFEELLPLFEDVDASFFEAATALAFTAFERERVDVAVIEVGLGGRLDASNIIEPLGSIITGVDLEHTRILGDTVEKIAAEKGGIIKRHPVVSAVSQPGARAVLRDIADSRGASLTFVDEGRSWRYHDGELDMLAPAGVRRVTPGLKGRHQAENAALALTLIDILDADGALEVPMSSREVGIAATRWPGRYDRQQTSAGGVIFDVAHNPAGARVLVEELGRDEGRPVNAVLGMLKDKPHRPVLDALRPMVDTLWVTTPDSERRLDAADLAVCAREAGYRRVRVEPVPAAAVRAAARASDGAPVLVTGSLFTVGAAMDGLGVVPADLPGGLGLLAGSET